MSEIFSRLRKSGPQRFASAPVAEVEAPELPAIQEIKDPARVVEEIASAPFALPEVEIREDAHFDLAAADLRIQSVLDPLTIVGEQYRLLRTKLSLMQKQSGIKTLLVTSSIPMEGKTFTACCLAGVFAQEPGKRVLLIDADLRKPRTGQELGMTALDHPGGLSQVLRGEKNAEQVLLSSAKLEFFLLPAGPVPDDPADLLSSATLESTIKRLSQLFDWVVIDSPPVISLADATLLAPVCDAALLVVRAGKTPAKMVKDAVQRLGKDKICGIVLNRNRRVRSDKYYYYNYYRKVGKRKS